jgi:hypothetical protein
MFTSMEKKTAAFMADEEHIESRGNRRDSATLSEIDGRLQEMAAESVPFYKNSNLLKLYLLMIPGCLVPSVTLGFDSAMMNGLQAVPAWNICEYLLFLQFLSLHCWLALRVLYL